MDLGVNISAEANDNSKSNIALGGSALSTSGLRVSNLNEISNVSFEGLQSALRSHAQIPRKDAIEAEVEGFKPAAFIYKIPTQFADTKELDKQLTRIRELRYQQAPKIEERLRKMTMNANMNTTENKPKPSAHDDRYREYVDNQVDMMGRLSSKYLK